MDKFHDLSPREKVLILIMLVLFAIVILWFLILSPLSRSYSDAKTQRMALQSDLEYVQRALPHLQNSHSSHADRPSFSRSAILKEASLVDAKISRIDAQRNGDLKITIDDTQATALFKMIKNIDVTYSTHAVSYTHLTLPTILLV